MWNPDQYGRFKTERKQPFTDLLGLVERRPSMRIVDLGCGTGELTRELHEELGAEETLGIDNSETMLLKTKSFGGEMLRFEEGDIAAFVTDRPYDLVFSNAALQWVPDHESLLHRLTSVLAQHGQLAVQMPANDQHPSHVIAAEVAAEFGAAPRANHVLLPQRYAEILHHLGYQRQLVRMQVYGHLLESSAAVVEWVKGTLLTDYEQKIGPGRYGEFLAEYTRRLVAALPRTRPYFYTYNRILFWASF